MVSIGRLVPWFAIVVLLPGLVSAAGRALPAEGAPPFFAYLASRDPLPALIAFNPSQLDMRKPVGTEPYPRERLAADLESLRPAFDGLVLYTYRSDVTPGILAEAARLGFRAVLLGVWDPNSVEELAGVAKLVRRYHDRLALAVSVGNEGLIDNRYTIDDLYAAADRLKATLPAGYRAPLTTSEPSGDYGFVRLRAFGDFLAPNIHPAIDRASLNPDAAAEWVRKRALTIAKVAKKPVLVKETGLPNGGAGAFAAEAQAMFWNAYLRHGRFVLNDGEPRTVWVSFAAAFEAFDAPWKAAKLESAIEGRWGLLTQDRRAYPAFAVWAASLRTEESFGR